MGQIMLTQMLCPRAEVFQQAYFHWRMLIYARLQLAHEIRVILPIFPTYSRKGGDFSMKKADLLSTLFVGIDVSFRENVACFLDFQSQKPLASFSVPNNQLSASTMA